MTAAVESAPVDYDELCKQLEIQEIECPGGVAPPQVYGQLLALYLLQNDLTNAKFLWKRIPQAVKTANADLALVWMVGQKIWQRDFPGVYESLKREWGGTIRPIMTALLESTRRRAMSLVGQAYSSISCEDFAAFVGLSPTEALEAAQSQGWTVDTQSKMILPTKPDKPAQVGISNEQQLERLTDYVSFLEN